MKKLIPLSCVILLLSACSSNQIIEERDIFLDHKILSHEVCGGDFSFDSEGFLQDSKQIEIIKSMAKGQDENDDLLDHLMCLNLIKNIAIETNVTELSDQEKEAAYKDFLNLLKIYEKS